LALAAFPAGARVAVVATGFDFPDALAASYLAGRVQAPIVLVAPHLPLPSQTLVALRGLRTQQILLVGLNQAVGDDVESALAHLSSTAPGGALISVSRIGGQDRYATMNLIDETPPATEIGTIGGVRTAILTTGQAFPDALAAGPLAYARGLPIVLTDPGSLSLAAAQTLLDLGIGQVLILGGPSAVSPSVEASVHQLGVATLGRLSGSDRSDTARLVGDWAIARLGFSAAHFDLASGDPADDGADALALGPLAARGTQPVTVQLLQGATDVGAGPLQFVRDHTTSLANDAHNVLAGGSDAAPDQIIGFIGDSLRAGVGPTVLPTLVGASLQAVTDPPAPPNSSGSVLRFLFDTDVSSAAFQPADFAAYDAAAPDAPFVGGVAIADPTDPDAVLVFVPTLAGSNLVGNLALATVKPGAVLERTGRTDPDGVAPIRNPLGPEGPAGLTTAPEALTATGTRPSAVVGQTALDVGFDTATTDGAEGRDAAGFSIVYPDQSGARQELPCLAPGLGDTAPSGGDVPGGNGTNVLTIVCPDDPGTPGTVLSTNQIARIVIRAGTVSTPPSSRGSSRADFLQVVLAPQRPSVSPDVVSATLIPSAVGGGNDSIVVNFDQSVVLGPVSRPGGDRFLVVTADGRPSPPAIGAVRSPDDPHQVEVTFGPDTDATAVGVQVLSGAVAQQGGAAMPNADDEIAVTNPATSARTPGRTAGPVTLSATRSGAVVVVTFDQPLAGPATPTLNALHAYDSDGVEMTCAAFGPEDQPFPDASAPATLECAAWAQGPTSYGPAASASIASSVVLVTVDRGMVANVAGQHNPEQAITVDGG